MVPYASVIFIFSNIIHKWTSWQFIWDTLIFNVKSLSYVVKAIIEVSCYFLIFRDYFYSLFVKICSFIWNAWFSKFPKYLENAPCGICFWKCSVLTFVIKVSSIISLFFIQFYYIWIIWNICPLFQSWSFYNFLPQIFCDKRFLRFLRITFVLRGDCLFNFFTNFFSHSHFQFFG